MAMKKRTVCFSALQARGMLSNEMEEDCAKIKTDIFDPIVAKELR